MDLHYEPIVVTSQYAPWKVDAEFQKAYQIFRAYTLVEESRCWELWDLLGQLQKVSGDLLEVGVWRGGTGCLLAWRARQLGLDCSVFLCDTFSGVPREKITAQDPVYRGGEHSDAKAEDVQALAAHHGLSNVTIVKGIFPAPVPWSASTFRLVHVDVDVYESAKETTLWATPRMADGGIIIYDDYGFRNCGGVTRYVDELKRGGYFVIHNLNGHAILIP